ncbi:DUF2441 domain-containing protein [Enterobacter quasiroggenkampii]|uniref:DUF2441 domain-containing protein n=1 Tax=Enterobacter quasiroggenkampii TaxID=2497436 RepID=UPI002DBA9E68|nr:DUF2441 domain-containing protein [Enterobacter quasiroggenkampii]MEB7931566.1 DUF2441 domain-containing protein [Enterobacter quasiroggenkampii]
MASDYFYIASKMQYPWSIHAPMKVGDLIETKEVNPFFNYFLGSYLPKMSVDDGFGKEAKTYTRMMYLHGIKSGSITPSLSSKDIATIGQELAMHFCKYTRELIWESVRLEHYNNLPSRQKCLWLAHGEQNLQYWKENLGLSDIKQNIFRVELDGITHEASNEHLMHDDIPYEQALSQAHRYWQGRISNISAKETLFIGKMKVVEQV